MTVHRSWEIGISDRVEITWFQKEADGSARVVDHYADAGKGIAHYADVVHEHGIDHDSVDYVPQDAMVCSAVTGKPLFHHMQDFGLNPKVWP